MKKFIRKVIFFLIFCMFITVIPAYASDPYNVFHWRSIRNNGINPNHNYIKTKYVLENPDMFDGYIFGSSRVGVIHVENIKEEKIFNFTASAGVPREHYETLKTFISNGVEIDTVYMGVDSLSYTEDPVPHHYQQLCSPYDFLIKNPQVFVQLYMDPAVIRQGFEAMRSGKEIHGFDAFYTYGWWCDYDEVSTVNWKKQKPFLGKSYLMEETLQDIRNIKTLCDENGIRLIVFTNPLYDITYQASLEKGYAEFLIRLADITDYYNFSGLNDITLNKDYFLDSSHYNAQAGDILIDSMVYGKNDPTLYEQGFGWYVTKENVSELIELIAP